jgi:hypothetical protein
VRTQIDGAGICQSCGKKLVSIDIDPKETENFATSLTNLACQKEVKADFVRFQVRKCLAFVDLKKSVYLELFGFFASWVLVF